MTPSDRVSGPREQKEPMIQMKRVVDTVGTISDEDNRDARRKNEGKATILLFPEELMVEIFKYLMWGLLEGSNWEYRIAFSHVCRYWRDIAINSQVLWTRIGIGKSSRTDQVAEYLQRSGASVICVRYNGNEASDVALECLCMTLEHLPRVRELHMQGLQHLTDKLMHALFQNPAPALQKFSLETNSAEAFDLGSVFSGEAPKLFALSMDANSTGWNRTPMLRSLTHLRIGSNSLSMPEIYSILSQNPGLEKFWIKSIPSFVSSDERPLAIPRREPIQLPFLKDIAIGNAGYAQLLDLFRSIDAPNITGWSIDCDCDEWPPGPRVFTTDPKGVMPCVPEREGDFYLEVKISGRHFSIDARHSHSEDISGQSTDIFDERDLSQKITYSWINDFPVIDTFDILCAVIGGSPWCSASAIVVDIQANSPCAIDLRRDERLGGEHWEPFLALFPDLRDITVMHSRSFNKHINTRVVRTETHHGIISALKRTCCDRHEDGTEYHGLICPRLRTLHLWGLDTSNSETVRFLLGALKYRSEHGRRFIVSELCITAVVENSGVGFESTN